MEKTKICPMCLKEYNKSHLKCDCGYEFIIIEEVEEEEKNKENITLVNDPTPMFVWQLISFLLPPLGFFFYFKWAKKWEERSKECGKTALTMSIVWFFIGLIWLLVAIGLKNGDILL